MNEMTPTNESRTSSRGRVDNWLADHSITEVEAMIPDMNGVARGKIVPARKFSEDRGIRLPESVFIQTVSGDYPDDDSMVDPVEPDIFARPDHSTMRLVPWFDDPTALVIHDCFDAQGKAVDIAPRYVLRHVIELYHRQGWAPVIAPELEFYLVKPNTDSDYPLEPPIGRSGRAESGRQSYSIDALNEFDPLLEDIDDYCAVQELDIETLTHESGAAQIEVNLLHGDPLALADQAFLFKRTVREAAYRHKMHATFMAKPMENEPGSAMHIHQSVVSIADGSNLFSDSNGDASALFYSFIAGLQRYLPACMPFLAPNVNSYRRLKRYHSAPINVEWGHDNRTAGLRVPNSTPDARRIENRVAGADANPYLAIASSLAAGYLGLMSKLPATSPLVGSAYELPRELPRNLPDSISSLNECSQMVDTLGDRFVKTFNTVKKTEYETFMHVISSWEREHLLLNV